MRSIGQPLVVCHNGLGRQDAHAIGIQPGAHDLTGQFLRSTVTRQVLDTRADLST